MLITTGAWQRAPKHRINDCLKGKEISFKKLRSPERSKRPTCLLRNCNRIPVPARAPKQKKKLVLLQVFLPQSKRKWNSEQEEFEEKGREIFNKNEVKRGYHWSGECFCKNEKKRKEKGGNSATSGTSDRDKQFPSVFLFTHARIKQIYARTVSLKNYSRVGRASMNFARGFPSSTANEQHNLSFCSIFLPFLFHFRKRKSRFPVDARHRNVHWINWKIYYGKERCTIISLLHVCLLCFFRGHCATRWYFLSTSSSLRELIKWQAKKKRLYSFNES